MVRAVWLLSLALLPACRTFRSPKWYTLDPVVVVHGPEQDELGVSTDYGIVFLGRSAKSGRVEFTAWFADGPSREEGVVEAVGEGLFATESEIQLPSVPLCFTPPPAGSVVRVRGRRGNVPFEFEARLAQDGRVTGILLEPNEEFDRNGAGTLGAGVFLVEGTKPVQLLGLVTGSLEFDGGPRYYTAMGPEVLWRLVVQRRNSERPRRWVYREDLL